MKNNTLLLSDLEFEVQGRIFAFLNQRGNLDWCIEIMSLTEEPFSVYITASPFGELTENKFEITALNFSYKIDHSPSFAFSSGGEMIFIDSFDVFFDKKPGDDIKKMHLNGRGRVDAMAGPGYMRNLDCVVSVDVLFDFFQCSDLIPINSAMETIKKLTGIEDRIKYLREGSGGTLLYGIE